MWYKEPVAQWKFIDWLMLWLLETSHFEFQWDAGNRTKNAKKHGVAIEEVESVFRLGLALPLGIQIAPKTDEQRLGIVEPGGFGRLLQIAFVLREGKVRVISARPAHRKELKSYEEALRKITKRI